MKFQKTLKEVGKLDLSSLPPISHMPQFYRAGWHFMASHEDGKFMPLMKQLLDLTQEPSKQFSVCSIDSRSHMLMPGMYPCIPGWHCDDFYRPESDILKGQPDLLNVHGKAPQRHFAFILGDNSRTEFVDEDLELPSPEQIIHRDGHEHPIYYHYDKMLEEKKPKTVSLEPGVLYEFGPHDFHRGEAAREPGWRHFMRITFSNHRFPKNEIRYQTQVYTTGRVSW